MSAFSDFMANLGRIVENPTLGDLPAVGGIMRGASPSTAQSPIFPHKQQVDALPLVGGVMNLGSKALVGVPLAATEAQIQGANQAIQKGDQFAGMTTAIMMVVAKGGRLKTALQDPNYVMTPDDINTAKANAALEQNDPMKAIEILQSGPDSTTSYVAGAGRLLLNPWNYAGGIGAGLKGVRGLGAAGEALQATDRFMALPFTAAGGALRQLPSGVARTLGGATAGAVGGAGYSKLTGDDQGLRDALIGAGVVGGVSGGSVFAKYLARTAPELAPAVAQDLAPAIAAAERAAPDLPSAIPSYDPLPRPALLPEAPNFPRPTGEPLPPLPPRVEPVAPPPLATPDLPPPPVGRPEPPAVTPAAPEPMATTPAAPANALSVGERGALLDRVTSGEFGPISQVLGALHDANYGANAAFALKGIYGKATVPADAVRNHLDYLLARTLDDPQRWDALAQRAPQLAQALDTVPLAQVPTDTMQQALRATLGRPLKGKLPPDAVLPTTERPVDEVAADILRATRAGDQGALDDFLNEYRALQQPKPEIATPAAPPAADIPAAAAEPVAAPANAVPAAEAAAPSAGDTMYQRAVGLLHGGDPQFNSPYVPGPTYFARRLPIDEATANSIVQRLVQDPAIVEIAPTGDALLRSAMNPKYRATPAGEGAPATSALDTMYQQIVATLRSGQTGFERDTKRRLRLIANDLGLSPDAVAPLWDRALKDPSRFPAPATARPSTLTPVQQAAADARNRLFGDTAAGDLGLNVGATLNSPLGKRAAAGALAGGLSTYGDPNATPEDVLMRGLVGAGVGASAPMALRGATKLAKQLLPDAPKAWQDLTANVLHDVTRIKEAPERVAEFGQEVALAARAAWQKGKAEFGGGDVPLYKAPAAALKQWRAQIVATLHNLLQDDLTTRGKYILFGKQDGVSLANFTETRASLRRNFNNADTFSKHSDGVQELLTDYGQQDYNVGQKLGANVIDEATQGTGLGPLQRGVVGAGISLANPITGLVPIPSIAYGAARGVMDPFVSAFFHFLNGFVHVAGREGYWVPVARPRVEAAATTFLDDLARQGVDTAALTTRGLKFAPNDVEQAALAAGKMPDEAATLAAQWDEAIKTALDTGAGRVRTVFGDMNALGGLGKTISGVAPFASWPISQAKITAELLAKYPGPAAVTAGAIRRNEEQLQARGEPGYYAASIPIPTDLPVLGGLARARLGGEKGTVYLSPASLLVPGTDPLTVSAPKEKDQQKTAYQRAQDLLGLAGLSWGPAVQAGAYATGQDYRRPSPLSRTAGLEAAVPGPSVTDWPVQALDAARKLIVPALSKAGVPTGGSGAPPDPIQKELAALVWARTGKVLGDPGTEQDLRDSFDTGSPLYQEALQRVKNRAALGNAVSVTSPFSISASPAVTSELYQAKAQTPYDYNALKTMETYAKRAPDARFTPEERQTLLDVARPLVQLPGGMPVEQVPAPLLAAMTLEVMNEANSNYQERVPASRVLGMTSTKNRTDALLQAWKEKHSGLTQWPAIYKAELVAYKKTIGAP